MRSLSSCSIYWNLFHWFLWNITKIKFFFDLHCSTRSKTRCSQTIFDGTSLRENDWFVKNLIFISLLESDKQPELWFLKPSTHEDWCNRWEYDHRHVEPTRQNNMANRNKPMPLNPLREYQRLPSIEFNWTHILDTVWTKQKVSRAMDLYRCRVHSNRQVVWKSVD